MSFLDNTGFESQIAYIKSYIQSQLINYFPLSGGSVSGSIQAPNITTEQITLKDHGIITYNSSTGCIEITIV